MPKAAFVLAAVLIATPLRSAPAEEVVRERRSFTVNGAKEVWRLVWRGNPHLHALTSAAHPERPLTLYQ
jgi:hypothetical protein